MAEIIHLLEEDQENFGTFIYRIKGHNVIWWRQRIKKIQKCEIEKNALYIWLEHSNMHLTQYFENEEDRDGIFFMIQKCLNEDLKYK